jgi:hypothetical protein
MVACKADAGAALENSIAISLDQNAMALLLRAFRSTQELGLSDVAGSGVSARITQAIPEIEPDEDMSRLVEAIKSDPDFASTPCNGA